MKREVLPMTAVHFFQMEYKLFQALEIDPRIIDILMRRGQGRTQVIERFQKKVFASGVDIFEGVKNLRKQAKKDGIVSQVNLSSVAFVISNSAVLFDSRDWSTAGVFSCMVGNAISSFKKLS